jgi:GAF domain-containing protein
MESIDETPLSKLQRVLADQGVVPALRILNGRAPHRFTGIYEFSPQILRNVHLIHAYEPETDHGSDVPINDAYCVLLADRQQISFGEPTDAAVSIPGTSPVVSYCGVLLVQANGEPFGSLCHFDTKRCQRPASELKLLELAAPQFMAAIERQRAL